MQEFSDAGPFAAMVDVTRRGVVVKVTVREGGAGERASLAGDVLSTEPVQGDEGELVFYAGLGGKSAAGAGAAARRLARVRVRCVFTEGRASVSGVGGTSVSGTRVLTFVGVSRNGGAGDPVIIDEAPADI